MTQWSFLGYHLCPQQFDHIQLIQFSPCSAYTSTGTCGAFLTAANRDPAIFGAACNSSVLTITADLSIHGLGIQCQNPISGAVIGNASLSVLCKLWRHQWVCPTMSPPSMQPVSHLTISMHPLVFNNWFDFSIIGSMFVPQFRWVLW